MVATRKPLDDAGLAGRASLRDLLAQPRLAPDRIFYHNIWFRRQSNPRYGALLPLLPRVDPYVVVCSDRRLLRGAQFRSLRATRTLRHRLVFGLATRRYCFTFSTDVEQAPFIGGPVVIDIDDPRFTEREAQLLNLPNVRAFVVTAERAAERYRQLGVRTPHHVIPQGVNVSLLDPDAAIAAASARRPAEVAVGYIAAWLLSKGDRGGDNPLYNTDHLFDLWEAVHVAAPSARLWLVGRPSDRVRQRCAGRDDIVLVGALTQPEALAYIRGFDIGLYPRTADQGIQAVKVAEYLGLGVPVVSYDYAVTQLVAEAGAGLLVKTPREFAEAVVALVHDTDRRRSLAEASGAAGRSLHWEALAERYEREILDVHLR